MFETVATFNDLDDIAAMDGIDALTIGPAGRAQDLGVFSLPEQARVLDEKRDQILAAAKNTARLVQCFAAVKSRRVTGKRQELCCFPIPAIARSCTIRGFRNGGNFNLSPASS
jgi:2-keto-3-deoxy-L-rhamnonate aldolase RhmA